MSNTELWGYFLADDFTYNMFNGPAKLGQRTCTMHSYCVYYIYSRQWLNLKHMFCMSGNARSSWCMIGRCLSSRWIHAQSYKFCEANLSSPTHCINLSLAIGLHQTVKYHTCINALTHGCRYSSSKWSEMLVVSALSNSRRHWRQTHSTNSKGPSNSKMSRQRTMMNALS